MPRRRVGRTAVWDMVASNGPPLGRQFRSPRISRIDRVSGTKACDLLLMHPTSANPQD